MLFSVVFRSDPMKRLFLTAFLCCAFGISAFGGPIAYAGAGGGQFGTLDLGTGVFTPIGQTNQPLVGLGYSNGTLFGLDSTGDLLSINPFPATFGVTPVGASNLPGSTFTVFTSLSGMLFAIDDTWTLFSINPATGAATSIGPINVGGNPLQPRGGFGYADSLAASANSLFFTLDLWTNTPGDVLASELYRIDPATGSATALGPTGQEDFSGSVMIGGTLYAFTGNFAGSTAHQIFTLNTSTGAATPYSSLQSAPASLYGATVGSPSNPQPFGSLSSPEPATFAIAGLALLGILGSRYRQSRGTLKKS
jgi:hypothetical protein